MPVFGLADLLGDALLTIAVEIVDLTRNEIIWENRALIAQENRRYARRQLTWFRKEPDLQWLNGPGESSATIAAAIALLDERLKEPVR